MIKTIIVSANSELESKSQKFGDLVNIWAVLPGPLELPLNVLHAFNALESRGNYGVTPNNMKWYTGH